MIAVNGLEDSSISVSLFPPSLTPPPNHTHLLPLSLPSAPLFVTHSPWFHRGSPSSWRLSPPLMAQLLALMHFKHTAAATPQSDRKCTSSTSLCSYFDAILSRCVAPHVKPSSTTPRSSSGCRLERAADANLVAFLQGKINERENGTDPQDALCGLEPGEPVPVIPGAPDYLRVFTFVNLLWFTSLNQDSQSSRDLPGRSLRIAGIVCRYVMFRTGTRE